MFSRLNKLDPGGYKRVSLGAMTRANAHLREGES